jgi:hydrogenase maturation factor
MFPAGKLPPAALNAALAALPMTDPRVTIGPALGEDAAAVTLGERTLVIATDPVTFATDRLGWYVVHVNANDVAVMGAPPCWFSCVVLLPERNASQTLVDTIMAEVGQTCAALGVTVVGGHTEVTVGLTRPLVVGQMIGEVDTDRLVRKQRLAPGDTVLLAGYAAIEGTALLARELGERLVVTVGETVLQRARDLLVQPGISVVRAALAAASGAPVHAMHDPTEGGILGGLWELAAVARVGLDVAADRIPLLPETREVCEALHIDPLALLASGALLIGVAPGDVRGVTQALAAEGVPVCAIANVLEAAAGVTITRDGARRDLVPPARDEAARILGG